jgi:hypothetical protein
MGRACNMCGKEMHTYFWLEDLGVDGRMMLEWLLGK